ncbi:hypothetical protein E2C00_33045 [Streptomyces sp. WAC05374]|uniref:SMI1/KNR4 family protein n=1 Tax=Streptomyces sp. WAC05374 TaxID=2487420 RepID=UPI000F86D432|nr:SMI1/KNR4 family protein [Streptomyces sp. WAC05374]RST16883.1 hypothetical protein EF905_11060 [Streptomyces sp. WAC05374]TDF36833.1 hypothetical protein E2B92_30695 [Streptomyces sp. WAC05374]TDF46291.1 hypothetical protein E2C02_32255 [Streptomyces sp. WAC05374]TDF46886.1 hypothetical protein E2C00_33045 [Streptomyces sp. WAC05374]
MDVEIPPHVRDAAAQLGAGVPYALKVLAGRLAEDPDMGRPSGPPGTLTVSVDGELFEDCPDLTIGYVREPDRIEIRYVNPSTPARTADDTHDDIHDEPHDRPADTASDTITGREVTDAWQRVSGWLRQHAPDSHAALRAGASPTVLTALERDLGVHIPAGLRALWLLTAGDEGVDGAGCLPGNQALMTPESVVAFHRQQSHAQARQDGLDAHRPARDRITVWKAAWIPVISYGVSDRTSGLYLDAATGYLGRWSRHDEGPGDELDTLVTYLEEVADMLEAPALATRDKPGLVGAALVWGSRLDPGLEERWQPLTGRPHGRGRP